MADIDARVSLFSASLWFGSSTHVITIGNMYRQKQNRAYFRKVPSRFSLFGAACQQKKGNNFGAFFRGFALLIL